VCISLPDLIVLAGKLSKCKRVAIRIAQGELGDLAFKARIRRGS